MKQPGQIALVKFPQTDLVSSKLRPVLLLAQIPNQYDDWLICMISSKTQQAIKELDEIMDEKASDFADSGLKVTSVFRITRLAVVSGDILVGTIGQISHQRIKQIKDKLAEWIRSS
ncbi:MAG: type II toxin-antitoxin system PemK/MazF family toxin [Deferribacteres bacterium]|nr:type II toxin-antitoxin system PemK/MazF family toxin [Deferribacteres bacterium]